MLTKIDTPLPHEIVVPTVPAEAHPTLILLHGRGANAHDLLPLAPELGRDDLLAIAPQAPFELGGAFGVGYAWYHLKAIGEPDAASYAESLAALETFLDAAIEGYPVDPARVFLLGFSQGTVMALALARRSPDRIAGIVALSGYLTDPSDPSEARALAGTPVFVGHGSQDEIFPIEVGRQTRDRLTEGGAQVSYHEYPAGHTITPAELADVRRWLQERLEAPP